MMFPGFRWIPVFCGVLLLSLANMGLAKEITFYSVPENSVNNNLEKMLRRHVPLREILFLNGDWLLKNPESGETIATVGIPCSFPQKAHFLLEKRFDLSSTGWEPAVLRLGPISGMMRIQLNGRLLFEGNGHYLPLSLAVPVGLLKAEGNVLRIDLENNYGRFSALPAFSPLHLPRVEAGILQGIYLEGLPGETSISAVTASAVRADSAITVNGHIRLSRPLPDGNAWRVRVSYYAGEALAADHILSAPSDSLPLPAWPAGKFAAWHPETPVRFWIDVSVDSAGTVVDRLRQSLAVREIELEKDRLRVNGRHYQWKGINYVYQTSEGSQVFDIERVRLDLKDIKARGFNAVRVVLFPLPPAFYAACEEVGLFCLQDLPFVYWGHRISQTPFDPRQWKAHYDYLREMSRRYSCIAAIGLGFYPNGKSPDHGRQLRRLVNYIQPSGGPATYVSVLSSTPELNAVVDFQLIDLIHRYPVEQHYSRFQSTFSGVTAIPSAFSHAFTYRRDSTTVMNDVALLYEFNRKLPANRLPGDVPGFFILTYNDYLSRLPSVQNGSDSLLYYNRRGIVTLKREEHTYLKTNTDPQGFVIPADSRRIEEGRGTRSYLYVLIGFVNVLLFLLLYNRYRIFRHNILYSFRKPHGFFVNLQERISIPVKQSLFLLLVIAVNGAIVFSAFAYFFRTDLLFDYLLSLIFFTPALKEPAAALVWNQPLFMIVATLFIIALFYLLAFFVKIFSLPGERRVFFNQALAITIWSAAPFILIIPLGVFLYSILLMMKSYWILVGVLLYFHAWTYLRWVNGIRVLTDRLYSRVFLALTFVLILLVGTGAYFIEANHGVWEHLQYVYQLYAERMGA